MQVMLFWEYTVKDVGLDFTIGVTCRMLWGFECVQGAEQCILCSRVLKDVARCCIYLIACSMVDVKQRRKFLL